MGTGEGREEVALIDCSLGAGRQSSFYCLALTCFCRSRVFYKLKVCGNPASTKSIGAIFPKHLLISCLCVTFWKFLQYFKLFRYYYICHGDL